MRVQVGVSSLHAEANPHYSSGKGATIYRFVSDQFSTFYTKVINTNARDAVHVIDGLLYHETDLDIEEHYTETPYFREKSIKIFYIYEENTLINTTLEMRYRMLLMQY